MTVHVDELHTEIETAGPPAAAGRRTEPLGAAEDRWREAHRRAEWLAARVAAEGFDD